MSATKRALGRWALLALLASPSPALAEDDHLSAERLFQLGRAAMNDSKYELARGYFEQSYKLESATGTLLNLAVCEEKVGRLTLSLAHLGEALAKAPPDDRRRPLISARLAELERRTPRVVLRPESPLESDIIVRLDSRPIDAAELGKTLRVD